jgi:serine/threonine protein kinase
MHSKCVFHLDLKPENILYEEGKMLIIDFGSAKYIPQLTQTNSYLGL